MSMLNDIQKMWDFTKEMVIFYIIAKIIAIIFVIAFMIWLFMHAGNFFAAPKPEYHPEHETQKVWNAETKVFVDTHIPVIHYAPPLQRDPPRLRSNY